MKIIVPNVSINVISCVKRHSNKKNSDYYVINFLDDSGEIGTAFISADLGASLCGMSNFILDANICIYNFGDGNYWRIDSGSVAF